MKIVKIITLLLIALSLASAQEETVKKEKKKFTIDDARKQYRENFYKPKTKLSEKLKEHYKKEYTPSYTKEEEAALREELKELAAIYQKKFGEYIKYDELLITKIAFSQGGYGSCGGFSNKDISITRNGNGAILKYKIRCDLRQEIKLTASEWLEFIRDLYKCKIDEWQELYKPGFYADGYTWDLFVSYLDMEPKMFVGLNELPPSWEELGNALKKLMKKKANIYLFM